MLSMTLHKVDLSTFSSARCCAPDALPWVPLSAGKAFKPLRFLRDDRGFVELLRLDPGSVIPRHRHTGEVHAFNLQGERELNTGEVIRVGGNVYEPSGNIDSWQVVGDEPLIVLVVVMGAVEYLDAEGAVCSRWTASRLLDLYRAHCAAVGAEALDLID